VIVIVIEPLDPSEYERVLSILAVVRLPPHRLYAAVQESAERVLDVFANQPPGSDAKTITPEDDHPDRR
jgi:hypothetical protein